MKVTVIPTVINALSTVPGKTGTGIGGLENKRTSRDNSNYGLDEIGWNIEKSPGDLRRLAITQTPVKNHQLTLI